MFRRIISFISIIAIAVSCAQISVLTGGGKDMAAPEIDSAKTYPFNGQTNFDQSEINIKFNEFIALSNPKDNIIITPQMVNAPTITAKNKRLKIVFNEELKENTTYSISFNRAVTDITEKNDSIFQFVFSTGDYIDSLSIQGNVSDGFTNVGDGDFLMALYPVSDTVAFDSIAYRLKPTYIGQTSESGDFRLNYLKEGEYYLFAIEDKNRNLKLDNDEKRAFLQTEPIKVDSAITGVELKSYRQKREECKLLDKRFTYPGKMELIFSAVPDTFQMTSTMELLKEDTDSEDSLIYWLASNPQSKMRFYTELNGEKDTLKPLYKGTPDKDASRSLKTTNNVSKGKLLPEEYLEITFSEPIGSFDSAGVKLFNADSVQISCEKEIVNLRTLRFLHPFEGEFEVLIDSLAVTSFYGNQNEEKTRISFENHAEDYYGTLIINLDSMVQQTVLVELINDKGEVVKTADYASQMTFEELAPLSYQLRLIFDENEDGKWTAGSLKEGRIPERVIYYSGSIQVKSRWEKEVDWSIKY